MADELGFLAHIRARPSDVVARLAFADWLEERETPAAAAKAEYLRTDTRLADLPADDPGRDDLIRRLRVLAADLPTWWKTAVARHAFEPCGVRWGFVCPQTWDRLRPTANPSVRTCRVCRKPVTYCDTIDDARELAVRGECVAVDLKVRREPGDLDEDTDDVLGMLDPADGLDDELDDPDFWDPKP